MSARSTTTPLHGVSELLTSLDAAYDHITATALRDAPAQLVGLELEGHLVDLAAPGRRPDGARVAHLLDTLPPMPAGSAITEEPGGQIELSTPPAATLDDAIAALRRDRDALGQALAARGYGAAHLGADPARPLAVVNSA